jgi:hypothetical protein
MVKTEKSVCIVGFEQVVKGGKSLAYCAIFNKMV